MHEGEKDRDVDERIDHAADASGECAERFLDYKGILEKVRAASTIAEVRGLAYWIMKKSGAVEAKLTEPEREIVTELSLKKWIEFCTTVAEAQEVIDAIHDSDHQGGASCEMLAVQKKAEIEKRAP
jgi:hypothetical protein